MNVGQIVRCRACSARIFFARTDRSERMPVDAEPSPAGNLAVTPAKTANGMPTAVVLRPAQAAGMRAAGELTYVSHFAGCPKAEEFRKRAQNKAKQAASRTRTTRARQR